MEILGQNPKSQQLLHHSCSGLSKKNTGGNWVEWDFRGIWYSSFPSSSSPHKHKSGDSPPSWCSVYMYRNVLFHISYLHTQTYTYVHIHTEDSFTVSGKGISSPTTPCSAIKLQKLSSKGQGPVQREVQASPSTISCQLRPTTYTLALSLQKSGLVLQKHAFMD